MHEGHRERMKNRFLSEGLDNFNQHQILELLLFYSIPRKDTNPLAHELIKRDGSLSGVLEAGYEDLTKVKAQAEIRPAPISDTGPVPPISRQMEKGPTEQLGKGREYADLFTAANIRYSMQSV